MLLSSRSVSAWRSGDKEIGSVPIKKMIELNLLPKELRKQKKIVLPEIPILPIAISAIAVVIAIHIVLYASVKGKRTQAARLDKKWEELAPQRKIADKFVEEIQDIESRIKAAKDVATPELSWTEILSGLNRAMVPDVWLSRFKTVFGKTKGKKQEEGTPIALDMAGYALGKSEIATSTVARFINSLKEQEEFSRYFEEIELQDMRNETIDEEEVMAFNLICKFKAK